jgi:hypothetical protein
MLSVWSRETKFRRAIDSSMRLSGKRPSFDVPRCQSVHALNGSPPNWHQVEVLMLWGHKSALWPSYCGSRLRLTELGGQQVSIDVGYLRGRALKTSLLAPWNHLGVDSRTMFEKDSATVWIEMAAAHHVWR